MNDTYTDKIREARDAYYAASNHLQELTASEPVYEDHQEELDSAFQAVEAAWQAWKDARARALEAAEQA